MSTQARTSCKPLYPAYLPTRPDGFIPAIDVPPFDGEEPGARADPSKPHLLGHGVETTNITPRIGTEVRGVQLSNLNKQGLDEVALLAAERGVVVFVSCAAETPVNSIDINDVERPGLCRHWIQQTTRPG